MDTKRDVLEEQKGNLQVIVLANQPRHLRHMLHRALTTASRVPVIIEVDDPAMIPRVLERVPVDWLITSLTAENKLPSPIEHVVAQHSSLAVIGISADGSHIAVHGHQHDCANPGRTQASFDEVSLSELIFILENS